MVFFNNLSDSVDSLLDSGYKALGAFSVKSTSSTKDGVGLCFNAKKKNGSPNVTGGFTFCQSFKKDDINVDLIGNITEDGTIKDEVTVQGFAEGVKVKVNSTILQKAETATAPLADEDKESKVVRNEIGGKLTYAHKKAGVNVGVTKKHLNPVVVALDVAGDVTDFASVGFKVSAPIKPSKEGEESDDCCSKVCDCDIALRLNHNDVTVVGQLTDCGRKSSLAIVHNCCSKLTVGAEFTNKGIELPFCFKKRDGEVAVAVKEDAKDAVTPQAWGLTFGFAYKTESNSTLRGKLDHTGTATCSYDFELKENLRANLVCETKVSALGQGSKLGLSLAYSA